MEEIKTKTGELNNLTIQAIQRMNEVDDSSNQLQKSTELRNTLLEEIAALTAEKETMTTGITTLKEELD